MTSTLAVPLVGAQLPRVSSVPAYVSSAGEEAIEFCDSFGLHLDPWQQHVLTHAVGERADGKWASFEVGIIVPRQNGKGSLLEARELAGLFLFDEQLILHSAHEFKTSQEAFRRVLYHVENTAALRKRVKRIRTSHGEEGIELTNGARLRFVARSTGSGRGFSGDCVILDEAFNLGSEGMAALLPTLSARPNPQIWYTSSAGMEKSEQLRRVRDRGIAGGSPRLAYFEWSAPPEADPADPETWAQANPALGIRISSEFVASEQAAMDSLAFARERLGIFDAETVAQWSVIPKGPWMSRAVAEGRPEDPVVFALAAAWPDGEAGSIAVAGRRGDEVLVQVVDHRPGMSWLVDEAKRLQRQHGAIIVVDKKGPAGRLVADLEAARVRVVHPNTDEVAQASGRFYAGICGDEPFLAHYDQPELNQAVASAAKRPLGDSWTWQRKGLTDISPLEAVSLAAWGLATHSAKSAYEDDGELMIV